MLDTKQHVQPVPLWLKALGAFSGLCLATLLVVHLIPAGRFTDGLLVLLDDPAIVFALAAVLLARSRSRGTARRVWGLLALGTLAWLAGEAVYEVRSALGAGSDASVADLFYLLFYPPVMAALILLAREDRPAQRPGRSLEIPILVGAMALTVWVLVRHTDIGATTSLGTQAVDIAYGVLDVGVLWMLLRPIARSDVRWAPARKLLVFAFAGILVADSIWIIAHTEVYGLIASSSFLLIGFAAGWHPDLAPPGSPPSRSRRRALGEVGVVAAGAVALSLLGALALADGVEADLVLGPALLLALVLVQLLLSITTNERLLRESEQRASTDPLTGLLNHGSFHENLTREIARARRDGTPLALLFVDLDHLKSVNDLAGHHAGDLAIRDLAQALRRMCRTSDLLCRTGGDEMAVIAPAINLAQAGELAERLVQAASGIHVDILGEDSPMSLSLGISVFPQLAADKHELIAQADAALYEAKQDGRGRWRAFEPQTATLTGDEQQLARARAQLAARESDFRAVFTHALEPMVITDGTTTIYEANDAAVDLAGVPREALIGRALAEFVTGVETSVLSAILDRLESASRERGEIRVTLPQGREALIEFSASRFSPTRFLVGLRDITDRTAAQRALALSESRFRGLFDSALDAIFITDDQGVIIDVNPAAATMTGHTRAELLGLPVTSLAPPEDEAAARLAAEELAREGKLTAVNEYVDDTGAQRVIEHSSVTNFVPGEHLSIVREITHRPVRVPAGSGLDEEPGRER